MRIEQVAPLYERVPPVLYGGTERVVSYLAEELVRRGHSVTLFASGDSVTSAHLSATTAKALRLDPAASDVLSPHVIELAQVFERANEFDLIHCHIDYLAFPFGRLVRTPTLHTLHGRLDLPHLMPLFRHFRDVPLVSISDAQRAPLRDVQLTWAGTVYHGLPLAAFPFPRRADITWPFSDESHPRSARTSASSWRSGSGCRSRSWRRWTPQTACTSGGTSPRSLTIH